MSALMRLYNGFLRAAQWLQAPLLLVIRLWIAHIFFASGLVKIHDFSDTLELFRTEYKVPVLPPYLAAVTSSLFELSCPLLLTLGLATRLATLPLLAMTAIIQFTYDQNIQHAYWAMLLAAILAFGPGLISADYFVARKWKGKRI